MFLPLQYTMCTACSSSLILFNFMHMPKSIVVIWQFHTVNIWNCIVRAHAAHSHKYIQHEQLFHSYCCCWFKDTLRIYTPARTHTFSSHEHEKKYGKQHQHNFQISHRRIGIYQSKSLGILFTFSKKLTPEKPNCSQLNLIILGNVYLFGYWVFVLYCLFANSIQLFTTLHYTMWFLLGCDV